LPSARCPPDFSRPFLAGKHLGDCAVALRLTVWTTLAIAPVVLLLFVQVRFLPYHEPWTLWHGGSSLPGYDKRRTPAEAGDSPLASVLNTN